ncbi:MAG: 16S rRNA (uracil(1498)-N(3))-methyltransferase [Dehalococcoidia bacterium]
MLEGDAGHRLRAVLRLKAGDEFLAFAGDGREYRATVSAVTKSAVNAFVGEIVRQAPAPAVALETWCALVRPNRFDWAIEKCVEAGADVIRPLVTEHAARGDSASASRRQRWDRIAVEAAEQSGRLYVPVVEAPLSFAQALHRYHGALIVADAAGAPLAEIAPLLPSRGHVAVVAGPEGGLSDAEREAARHAGALLLRLGPYILRTETAAVVATAVLRSSLP